jgi:sugar transferase (PEP-CTERM/EpsH1 system associated)
MKILWVKAGGLVPPDTGGKIRSYHILRELARQHSVTFFSFYAAHDNDVHPQLNLVFDHIHCLPLQLPDARGGRELLDYAKSLPSRQPYGVSKYCLPEVRQKLRSIVAQDNFDVIVCDFLAAAGAIPWDLPCPKVLFTHNVEAMIWKRHYEVAGNLAWKAISWLEWRKMFAAEQRYLQLADHVLAVSDNDRDSFAQFLDPSRMTVIPTGVDTEFFQPTSEEEAPNSLVFTGSMDWLPNEDGIIFFGEQVLPLIRRQFPSVSVTVVGRKPSRKLQEMAQSAQLQLTGWVDDIRPYLSRGAVCIVPLRIGGGTRLKIFEAMAMAKAVVSTTVGAEGLPVANGENVLLADSPQDFADSVAWLFNNPDRCKRLGSAARRLVEENYSWEKVAVTFAETLNHVAGEHVSQTQAQGLRK